MKRTTAVLAMAAMALFFSGCSIISRVVDKAGPHSTPTVAHDTPTVAAPEETPDTGDAEQAPPPDSTPEPAAEATPEPASEPKAEPSVYSSAELGVAFTVPESWAGKYRVEEGEDYLTVYFQPDEDIEEGMGTLFSIVKKTEEDDVYFLDNTSEFEANGATYLFGTPTDVSYLEEYPEYDTFVKMQGDLPSIVKTMQAAE